MRRKHSAVYFFGTKNDLSSGLKAIEAKIGLQYVEYRPYETKTAPSYNSAFDIPDFGRVHERCSPCFIVMPQHKRIVYRRNAMIPKCSPGWLGVRPGWRKNLAFIISLLGIRLPGAKVRYDIFPIDHPSSIVFYPGGFFDEHTLLSGEISTTLRTKPSLELYELFTKELLRKFTKIKGKVALLGPEAYDCLKNGIRLTSDTQASPEIDFRI